MGTMITLEINPCDVPMVLRNTTKDRVGMVSYIVAFDRTSLRPLNVQTPTRSLFVQQQTVLTCALSKSTTTTFMESSLSGHGRIRPTSVFAHCTKLVKRIGCPNLTRGSRMYLPC